MFLSSPRRRWSFNCYLASTPNSVLFSNFKKKKKKCMYLHPSLASFFEFSTEKPINNFFLMLWPWSGHHKLILYFWFSCKFWVAVSPSFLLCNKCWMALSKKIVFPSELFLFFYLLNVLVFHHPRFLWGDFHITILHREAKKPRPMID